MAAPLIHEDQLLGAIAVADGGSDEVFPAEAGDVLEQLASIGAATDRSELRRLLYRPAILWLGCHCLQLFVAEVGLYPQGAGCFRSDLVCVVRNLRVCFPHFAQLQQGC